MIAVHVGPPCVLCSLEGGIASVREPEPLPFLINFNVMAVLLNEADREEFESKSQRGRLSGDRPAPVSTPPSFPPPPSLLLPWKYLAQRSSESSAGAGYPTCSACARRLCEWLLCMRGCVCACVGGWPPGNVYCVQGVFFPFLFSLSISQTVVSEIPAAQLE